MPECGIQKIHSSDHGSGNDGCWEENKNGKHSSKTPHVNCTDDGDSADDSPVPISLTNLVIFFMAYILGTKLSVVSYVLYLLLGTVGLPVFSGFSGGVGKLLGPTGGYLIGFIFLAAISGFFVEKFPAKIYMHVIGMILGMAVCYAFGTAWLAGQLGMSFVAGLGVGVIPYLPGDTAKIIIAIIAGPQIREAVSRFM